MAIDPRVKTYGRSFSSAGQKVTPRKSTPDPAPSTSSSFEMPAFEMPDFAGLAEAQGQANIEAARVSGRMNNPNIFGPFGSQQVTWSGDQPTITQELSGPQQSLKYLQEQTGIKRGKAANRMAAQQLEYAPGLARTAYQQMSQPFDMGSLPEGGQMFALSDLPEISPGTMERDKVEQALMERQRPELQRMRDQQQEQLMMQGHNRGGSAWDAIQDDITKRETDARLAAILAGGQEQSRLYDLEASNRARAMGERMDMFGLREQNRNQALQEQLFERNLPMQELNMMLGQNTQPLQGPTVPQYPAYQGQAVQPSPVMDAGIQSANMGLQQRQLGMQDRLARDQMALQQQIANQNAQAAESANRTRGLFQIGSAAVQARPWEWF